MKALIISLMVVLVATSVSAQQPSSTTIRKASELSDEMNKDGIHSATLTSQEGGVQGGNATPRHTSPPAKRTGSGSTGTAKAATAAGGVQTKIDTLPNGDIIGPNFAVFGGVTHVPDGNGGWKVAGAQPAQQVPVQQQPVQQQTPVHQALASVPSDIWESQLTGTILTKQADGTFDYPGSGSVGGGSAQGMGSATSLPQGSIVLPNGIILVTLKTNGVESTKAFMPSGEIIALDGNAELAKLTLNGTDFALSGGEVEVGGKRNSYKYGMREAAGHTGQYYRRGAGTVLAGVANTLVGATGVTVGVGGAYCPPTGVICRQPARAGHGPAGICDWRALRAQRGLGY